MSNTGMLFALIRTALGGAGLTGDELEQLKIEQLSYLTALSQKHDVAHLFAKGLELSGIKYSEAENNVFKAIYRHEQMDHEFEKLCSCLEKAAIPYMPLKGAVIRKYYPEPWLRTSCDIDVLVHEQDVCRAVDALVEDGWESERKREYHDVSLYSKSGVHLELHFNIQENMDNIDALLSRVWEFSYRKNERGFGYLQTNEFFVFHHIAHMSYHFISGGCGIKPFVDLYVIKNKLKYDGGIVRDYCRQCGIEKFYDNMLLLTEVWFGGADHTDISRQAEEYVLRGGVYGSWENRVVLAQNKKGGKANYILSRIFLPYRALKTQYPIIKKHKWLFPFMQVARWFRFLKKREFDRSINEVKINNSVSKSKAEQTERFLAEIGL